MKSVCLAFSLLVAVLAPNILFGQDYQTTRHREGLHENLPNYLVVDAKKIVLRPGQEIDNGRLILKDGKVLAAGPRGQIKVPEGVSVLNLKDKTIYPGLINAYKSQSVSKESRTNAYWNDRIRPELQLSSKLTNSLISDDAGRKSGITAMLMAPSGAIIDGTSCFVLNGGSDESADRILKTDVFQHAHLTAAYGNGFSGYPNSPMGAVALARQAMYDASWYQKSMQVAKANPIAKRPEFNSSLQSMAPVVTGDRALMVRTSNEQFVLRADRFAKEFGASLVVLGSGNEYRRVREIAETGRTIICPVAFPKAPNVKTVNQARNATLEQLMHWDHAPENPSRLAKHQIPFCFTTDRLSSSSDFLKQVRIAVKRGLDKEEALRALTTRPAKLVGLENQVGTLLKGSYANFVVVDGDLFENKTKVCETWVAGRRYQFKAEADFDVQGKWAFEVEATDQTDSISEKVVIKSKDASSITLAIVKEDPESEEKGSDQEKSKALTISDVKRNAVLVDGLLKGGSLQGVAQWSFVLDSKNAEQIEGKFVWPNGTVAAMTLSRLEENQEEGSEKKKETKQKKDKQKEKILGASFAVNYPLGAYGKQKLPAVPKRFLFKNFTVWTSGKAGIIKGGSVLIGNGKILKIYQSNETLPQDEQLQVIEGDGRHLSPGIIDCHSHMATDSGVNESGQAITAEVRIGDMIDCDDITIYRQLAGGTTSSNILHGSANPIGGQNQVIKLRWGTGEQAMKFHQAPQGIKFALGENVKRSNGGRRSSRYPTTRMGVQQIMRDAFYAASEYRLAHRQWKIKREGLPPRIDLEMEALAEIIEGTRWVHCHSYRQDEILALIRTLEKFNVQIGTFQHILEGYKVADAMNETDAMASAFADWWAYKLEVADAIPYAGKLMHDAGVIVSFNSDDRELGRRLNHEAAKAVKYGGLDPAEALKFVTLNPAKQLRVDKYVGSIEVGKHADIVVWNGSPLSAMSRVDQTWIDGRKYFDRQADLEQRKEVQRMRQILIQKILDKNSPMVTGAEKVDPDPARLWPRFDEFCKAKGRH